MFNQCCNTCPSIGGGDCSFTANCIGDALPLIAEIEEVKRLFPEVSWGCHSNPKLICKGLVYHMPDAGYSKKAGIIDPGNFESYGWSIAITHAKLHGKTVTGDEMLAVLQEVTTKLRGSSYLRKLKSRL